ncbi:MAG: hypothetical protein ACJ72D_28935 [Marmoricola sp.]
MVEAGSDVQVVRTWLPWRLHTTAARRLFSRMWGEPVDHSGTDGLVTSIGPDLAPGRFWLWVVLIAVGGALLGLAMAGEALVLYVVALPVVTLARFVGLLPWTVEERSGGAVLEVRRVRGWQSSSELIRSTRRTP